LGTGDGDRCRDHEGCAAPPHRECDLTVAAVLGPTAAGKTEIAVALAEMVGGEIVSVDSMQVYRGMDIGTAKASAELQGRVSHHLVDLVDPSDSFSVAQFQAAGRGVLDALDRRAIRAVVAGGSGLHFRALVDPLEFPPTDDDVRRELEAVEPDALVAELRAADPEVDSHVDLANPRRVLRAVEILRLTGATPSQRASSPEAAAVRSYHPVRPICAIGLDPGNRLAERVERRFDAMLEAGLLDEVTHLAPSLGATARHAVGYKELLGVVAGQTSVEEARQRAIHATLALAKRQRTFFRRDPRIQWIPWHDDAADRVAAARAAVEEASWIS
jgi:tRNA dimethylallyltransferase